MFSSVEQKGRKRVPLGTLSPSSVRNGHVTRRICLALLTIYQWQYNTGSHYVFQASVIGRGVALDSKPPASNRTVPVSRSETPTHADKICQQLSHSVQCSGSHSSANEASLICVKMLIRIQQHKGSRLVTPTIAGKTYPVPYQHSEAAGSGITAATPNELIRLVGSSKRLKHMVLKHYLPLRPLPSKSHKAATTRELLGLLQRELNWKNRRNFLLAKGLLEMNTPCSNWMGSKHTHLSLYPNMSHELLLS
ncbi:hypothetical protein ACET3Z_008194 [Daucus carota]